MSHTNERHPAMLGYPGFIRDHLNRWLEATRIGTWYVMRAADAIPNDPLNSGVEGHNAEMYVHLLQE